jgi:bifunctional oligoribonuclease and PAP phosphatase NrnA
MLTFKASCERLSKRSFFKLRFTAKHNKEIMFNDFIKKLKNYKSVGVFSHVRPDGDCIGAQVALCRWLEKNGWNAQAFNDDDIPPNMKWLAAHFPIVKPDRENLEQLDAVIMVDGNMPSRFGLIEEHYQSLKLPLFMIDHHPDPEDVFRESISVPKASSTCELIYELYRETDISQLDTVAAKALYTGIITDTGSLQFDSVTPDTVEIVADLLRRGKFKPNEIIEKIYSNRTLSQFRLLSLALNTIQMFENNQVAVMHVTQQMMLDTGTSNVDTEGFVNYPLSIEGVKVAIIFKDLDAEGVKMSLRSRSRVDVNAWARELGGGGHKKAAGAWHEGPLQKAISDTIEIGKKQLKQIETPAET